LRNLRYISASLPPTTQQWGTNIEGDIQILLKEYNLQKERLNYVRTGSGAHTAACFMESGTLFLKKNCLGLKGKKSVDLVSRLRMLGFITQLLHTPAWYITEFSTGFTVKLIY